MSASERISMDRDEEIDVVSMLSVMWQRKWLIVSTTGLFVVAAVAFALIATPIYRASVVVTQVEDSSISGVSSLASQLGGFASLAGVNLGAGGSASREARAVLESRQMVEEFIKRNDLLPALFPEAKQPPTLWLGVEQFRNSVIRIREEKPKGTTTVAIEWTDSAVAAHWANEFVALANEVVRARALNDATRNIAYLNEQIAKTNVVEVQRVMYSLVEKETKTLMLANARVEYAFTVVDPAVPPEFRIRPKRTVLVIIGTLLGFCLGTVAALFLNSLDQHRRKLAQGA